MKIDLTIDFEALLLAAKAKHRQYVDKIDEYRPLYRIDVENGKLLGGAWELTIGKYRYWYGPSYYKSAAAYTYLVQEIDGDTYEWDTVANMNNAATLETVHSLTVKI